MRQLAGCEVFGERGGKGRKKSDDLKRCRSRAEVASAGECRTVPMTCTSISIARQPRFARWPLSNVARSSAFFLFFFSRCLLVILAYSSGQMGRFSKAQLRAYATSLSAWELPRKPSTVAPPDVCTNEDMDPVPAHLRTWTGWTFALYCVYCAILFREMGSIANAFAALLKGVPISSTLYVLFQYTLYHSASICLYRHPPRRSFPSRRTAAPKLKWG